MAGIADAIGYILSFLDEPEYINLRILNNEWRAAVERAVIHNIVRRPFYPILPVHKLIRNRQYISALRSLQRTPCVSSTTFYYYPNGALTAACEIPHYGLINYILTHYPRISTTGGLDKIFSLRTVHHIQALAIFVRHGCNDNRITRKIAFEHNATELISILSVRQPSNLPHQLHLAITFNDIAHAEKFVRPDRKGGKQYLCSFAVFDYILSCSPEIAAVVARYLHSNNFRTSLKLLSMPEYADSKYNLVRNVITSQIRALDMIG